MFLGFRTHTVERLGLNGPESFRLFSVVLNGEALLQWQRLLATLYAQANRRTPQGFIRAQEALLVAIEGNQVGNNLLSYLSKAGECMKPYKWSPITFKKRFK